MKITQEEYRNLIEELHKITSTVYAQNSNTNFVLYTEADAKRIEEITEILKKVEVVSA